MGDADVSSTVGHSFRSSNTDQLKRTDPASLLSWTCTSESPTAIITFTHLLKNCRYSGRGEQQNIHYGMEMLSVHRMSRGRWTVDEGERIASHTGTHHRDVTTEDFKKPLSSLAD